MPETLNSVIGLQEIDRAEGGLLLPADWLPGQPTIPNTRHGVDGFYAAREGRDSSWSKGCSSLRSVLTGARNWLSQALTTSPYAKDGSVIDVSGGGGAASHNIANGGETGGVGDEDQELWVKHAK